MKTVIASLKAQIEAAKKSIEIHETAKKELWSDLLNASRNGAQVETVEKLAKCHEETREELRKAEWKLSCLRSALVSTRQANGESASDIDVFAPEFGC